MDTLDTSGSPEPTTPTPPEGLDLAGQLSFARVHARLGLAAKTEGQTRIGDFELRGTLGEGGMGVVYLAHDPALGREVAIKLIQIRRHLSPKTLRARLEREGRALAQLSHPNVVSVHARGEHEGEPYLVMEYVAGHNLREWQRATGPSDDDLLRALVDAGRGLAAAHDAGIVHRDFKPENVLVSEDGRVQVSDFGLADLLSEPSGEVDTDRSAEEDEAEGSERLTKVGEVLGTLGYMAPEQLRGESADARSDQYAYCASLWQALTGELPFPATTADELIEATLTDEPRGGEGLNRRLRALLRRGLDSDPARRHPDMRALVEALEHERRRKGRLLRKGAFLAALLLAATGVTSFALSEPRRAPAQAPCELQQRLSVGADWEALRGQLDGAGSALIDALQAQRGSLDARAPALCAAGRPAELERALAWLDELELLLNSTENSPERLLGYMERLRERSWDRAPSRPLTPSVKALLAEASALELDNELVAAAQKLSEGARVAAQGVDRAELELRAGRLLTLSGDYEKAERAYRSAAAAADIDADDGIRLRAYLLVAELVIKRLEQSARAQAELKAIEGVLARVGEPWISERRARYHNLRATVSRRGQDFNAALHEQRRALSMLVLSGAPAHIIARDLLALGSIHESGGDAAMAERCYRLALKMLPDDASPDRAQAVYFLGSLLADTSSQQHEARVFLREAVEGRRELRLAGLTRLANLEVVVDEPDAAELESLAAELEAELEAGSGTPSNRSSGWQALSYIYARQDPFSERFEQARERSYALLADDEVELASFELTLAGMADEPQLRRTFGAKACARLESLSPDPAIEDMLAYCRELLLDLDL